MRDLRAERIHRHELRRARTRKFKRLGKQGWTPRGGTYQGKQAKTEFHLGTENTVFFDEERNRILQRKEAQRRRRARETK